MSISSPFPIWVNEPAPAITPDALRPSVPVSTVSADELLSRLMALLRLRLLSWAAIVAVLPGASSIAPLIVEPVSNSNVLLTPLNRMASACAPLPFRPPKMLPLLATVLLLPEIPMPTPPAPTVPPAPPRPPVIVPKFWMSLPFPPTLSPAPPPPPLPE